MTALLPLADRSFASLIGTTIPVHIVDVGQTRSTAAYLSGSQAQAADQVG